MSAGAHATGVRRRVAFLEHANVFEDFYPHYGVTQEQFAAIWHGSGNHALVRQIQQDIADVTWYEFSLQPTAADGIHGWTGSRVRFLKSPLLHRLLWRMFYLSPQAWRWRGYYRQFSTLASYVGTLSFALFRALLRDQPHTIFCQDYATGRFDVLLVLARMMGLRIVAYHAGSTPAHYLGKGLRRLTLRHADQLLVSSQRELEWLVTEFKVPRERLQILLAPIDTEAFAPTEREAACAQANLDPSRRYLLYVGRLEDRIKRVGLLLRTFAEVAAEHADVDLLIVGDGSDRAALEGEAAASGPGRVHFLGWRSGAAALAPLYNAAECTVLISRSEGFPMVVGESMACGTPLIATDVGGISELVEHERTGWLIAPESDDSVSAALRTALTHALTSPAVLTGMRSHARERAMAAVSRTSVVSQLRKALAP